MKPNIYVIFFLVFVLIGVSEVFGQHHLYTEWEKTRTSSLSGGNAEGWGVDTDPQGNIYWSASFDSTSTNRLYDIMTYKYNPAGQEK